MEENEIKNLQVQCLSDAAGLQRACQAANVRFSSETNKFLVYETLQKLGPSAAQRLVSKLVDDGFIKWEEDETFEVEFILDHADEDQHGSKLPVKRSLPKMKESYQLSKRRKVDEIFHKLWCSPMPENMSPLQLLTLHNLRIGVENVDKPVVHKGLIPSHNRNMRPKFLATTLNYSNVKKKVYRQKKLEVQAALKDWEEKLNAINTDPAPIVVENDADLEGPPDNFVYINDYRAGEGIEIPQDPIIGCECKNCLDERKSCCAAACGSEFAYYKNKRLRVPQGTPVYECNKRCKCGPECPNRVVQNGRKFKVCIFRTSNARGWGVKTLQRIKKGSFVMEYVGEVITNEEAERRGKIYDAEGRTYLFDLDYNDGDCPFTVDAGYYGNVSHFVNHSCEPNLVVYGVWINTLDPRLPRICLFAARDINKGEELTFDYMMTGDTTQSQQPMGLFLPLCSPVKDACNNDISAGIRISTTEDESSTANDISDIKERKNTGEKIEEWDSLVQPVKPASPTFARSSMSKICERSSPKKQPKMSDPATAENNSRADGEEKKTDKLQGQSKMKYRMICQCGSAKCRKYLF
ncbi:hypothetical protein C0Q70_14848 [Pomacea canaliculata]|uniref:Uncharacterized protein n=1 Tax=Pomacea canaliculata TaxID=400727 RepID=A0A2T7NT61_POMCA|nr:hypothetical protein C0Q70_14848 [Pomacea canaliculata]